MERCQSSIRWCVRASRQRAFVCSTLPSCISSASAEPTVYTGNMLPGRLPAVAELATAASAGWPRSATFRCCVNNSRHAGAAGAAAQQVWEESGRGELPPSKTAAWQLNAGRPYIRGPAELHAPLSHMLLLCSQRGHRGVYAILFAGRSTRARLNSTCLMSREFPVVCWLGRGTRPRSWHSLRLQMHCWAS